MRRVGDVEQAEVAPPELVADTAWVGGIGIARNVYGFFVSTHDPSSVTADGGGPVYYQQQLLATVACSALGI